MISRYLTAGAAAERLNLLPLLPVRPLQHPLSRLLSHDTPSDPVASNSVSQRSGLPSGDSKGEPAREDLDEAWTSSIGGPNPTPAAAQRRWDWLLQHATVSVLDASLSEAVRWLQRAHAWKNRWETYAGQFLALKPDHWVTLSACSIAVGDDDIAAQFAIHAWHAAGHRWVDDLEHDFRNSRADAATLLALNRLRQRHPDRAAKLLECGIEGHRQVGDLEQLAADYMMLSLCFEAGAEFSRAVEARQSATMILTESLDPSRHLRRPSLAVWLRRHGHPRPLLMKDSRLV